MLVINEVQSDWVQRAYKRVKETDQQMFLTQEEAKEIFDSQNAKRVTNLKYLVKFNNITSTIENIFRQNNFNAPKDVMDYLDKISRKNSV